MTQSGHRGPLPERRRGLLRCRISASGATTMRRRDFVTLLGGTAAAWPLVVQAQQLAQTRRVSVLLGLTENDPLQNIRLKAFRLGMRDLEWIEGRNVRIDYRFAGANLALIDQHVAELIRLAPDA